MRDRDGTAQKRAERVGWRPQQSGQASRSMDERLREMNERAVALDGRLHRHAEERASPHRGWDGPHCSTWGSYERPAPRPTSTGGKLLGWTAPLTGARLYRRSNRPAAP